MCTMLEDRDRAKVAEKARADKNRETENDKVDKAKAQEEQKKKITGLEPHGIHEPLAQRLSESQEMLKKLSPPDP